MNETKYEHIVHPFPPLYNSESRILILGSLPSVKSREQMFFYGHPQNRFWKMISGVFKEAVPQTIEEKKAFMLKHNIALWDTIYSCDIIGSSDSSIKNVEPTDLKSIVDNSKIEKVICNGKTSGKYYEKYQMKYLGIKPDILPSTSPANAAMITANMTAALLFFIVLPFLYSSSASAALIMIAHSIRFFWSAHPISYALWISPWKL